VILRHSTTPHDLLEFVGKERIHEELKNERLIEAVRQAYKESAKYRGTGVDGLSATSPLIDLTFCEANAYVDILSVYR
jgi:hypothetical protein